jgi:5-carboxymethyl-2-hydroxymuconate isomerase
MPHLIIEYAASLEQEIDLENLTQSLHELLGKQPSFEPTSIKSRAKAYNFFTVGEPDHKNRFMHIQIRILEGRQPTDIKNAMQAIGQWTAANLPKQVDITVEMVEMKKDYYLKVS